VSFDLFRELAPKHQPLSDLKSTIVELKEGLDRAGFQDQNYRQSQYVRLNVINKLHAVGLLNDNLEWISSN
jgi:hypothetical protein